MKTLKDLYYNQPSLLENLTNAAATLQTDNTENADEQVLEEHKLVLLENEMKRLIKEKYGNLLRMNRKSVKIDFELYYSDNSPLFLNWGEAVFGIAYDKETDKIKYLISPSRNNAEPTAEELQSEYLNRKTLRIYDFNLSKKRVTEIAEICLKYLEEKINGDIRKEKYEEISYDFGVNLQIAKKIYLWCYKNQLDYQDPKTKSVIEDKIEREEWF